MVVRIQSALTTGFLKPVFFRLGRVSLEKQAIKVSQGSTHCLNATLKYRDLP